jgi:hypothetical protein
MKSTDKLICELKNRLLDVDDELIYDSYICDLEKLIILLKGLKNEKLH